MCFDWWLKSIGRLVCLQFKGDWMPVWVGWMTEKRWRSFKLSAVSCQLSGIKGATSCQLPEYTHYSVSARSSLQTWMQYFSRLLTSGQENLPPDSLHALCTMLSAFCPRPLCHPIHNQPHVNPGEAWFHYQHKIDCRRKVITWFLSKHCLFTFPWVLVLSEVEVLVIGSK